MSPLVFLIPTDDLGLAGDNTSLAGKRPTVEISCLCMDLDGEGTEGTEGTLNISFDRTNGGTGGIFGRRAAMNLSIEVLITTE